MLPIVSAASRRNVHGLNVYPNAIAMSPEINRSVSVDIEIAKDVAINTNHKLPRNLTSKLSSVSSIMRIHAMSTNPSKNIKNILLLS
ncbi:TPA: hypothetical protein DEP21_05210 [Patescibacteria group bacterium]|nr:hypothetical protein [Candidatus Gracilibacteria bacterium]